MMNFDPFFIFMSKTRGIIVKNISHHRAVLTLFYRIPFINERRLKDPFAKRLTKEVGNKKRVSTVIILN